MWHSVEVDEDVEARLAALEHAVRNLGELLMFITNEPRRQELDQQMEENLRQMAERRAELAKHRGQKDQLRERAATSLDGIPYAG